MQVATDSSTQISSLTTELQTRILLIVYGITDCSWNRHSNKPLDLSRTIRLSGLSSGAKLELVLHSRSPAAVSVALQLPEAETSGTTTQRLTHKFPSNTSLWLILRKFESNIGVDNVPDRNFTARGAPKLDNGSIGAGRLYYETPVLQVMGRELSSFVELQKTLSQLGFNSGSVLMRLSFRITETPLEESMQEIGQYFKSVEGEQSGRTLVESEAVREPTQNPSKSSPVKSSPRPEEPAAREDTTLSDAVSVSVNQGATFPPVHDDISILDSDHRPVSVYAAPSSSTPRAALQPFNEKDYEPTIAHAKIHQSRLVATSRNQRLKNHSEVEAEIEAQKQKAANITEVEIKVRFPDQMQVISKFSSQDTSTSLYDFVRSCLENEGEPFLLKFTGPRGPQPIPKEGSAVRLIAGLGMIGRVLVNFIWEEGASVEARVGKVLKDRFREKAKEIEVKNVVVEHDDDAEEQKRDHNHKPVPEAKSDSKGKGVPKWLKLPGKK